VVAVEEVSTLRIARDNWIALETRPGNGNGVAPVGAEELLHGAVRMRPDRLVVSDVRGGEAFALAQAMLASADGTLASISGEGALSALDRFAFLAGLSCSGDLGARRELVGAAVDVVVHVVRYGDGIVRIASIDEVTGGGASGFTTQNLFRYDESGTFRASGIAASFYGDLASRGIAADSSVFSS